MSKVLNYLSTGNSVVIVFADASPLPISSVHPLFERIRTALRSGAEDALNTLLDEAKRIKQYSDGVFWVKDGVVMIGDRTLPDALSKRLMTFVDSNISDGTTALVNFWSNLVQNPNPESVKDLYAFLEHRGIPITQDGHFMAYKRVDSNFKDFHTGKLDYGIGKSVSMRREDCDSDRNSHCSRGLHVAAYGYARDFYSGGQGNLIECKVNPRDVVAVPLDASGEKMRVCELYVLAKAEGERQELVYPRFEVGDEVTCENEDGSTLGGEIVDVIRAANGEVEASYDVRLHGGTSVTYQYKESALIFTFPSDASDEDFEDSDETGEDDDGFEVVRVEDLDRRLSDLEKNAATKKDVADSTNAVIEQLKQISKKMDSDAK